MTEATNTQHPRVTEQRIDDVIVKETYFQPPETTTTICMLTLMNGFIVLGKSACVSAEQFDAELGQEYARLDARRQVYELEGYLMKQWQYINDNWPADESKGAVETGRILSAIDGQPLVKGAA